MFKFFQSKFFPFKQNRLTYFKHEAIIGLGGNEGDVKRRFDRLCRCWINDRRVRILQTSNILQNPPFGYLDQNSFLNAVMKVQTSMSAKEFLAFLMHYEKKFGRIRSFKNAPRTLDLDIIFFDDLKLKSNKLNIPHPYWDERISVLVPLLKLEKGR